MPEFPSSINSGNRRSLDLARVLLVHGDLASRLTLRTLLQAGGYAVDVAATPAEALAKLDAGRYDLVLSDHEFGSRPAGRTVLAYARVKDYRPATALITSDELTLKRRYQSRRRPMMAIYTENVPTLLGKVADLIGLRASRRYRPVRQGI
jgi:CheY-like chemotaxis protein